MQTVQWFKVPAQQAVEQGQEPTGEGLVIAPGIMHIHGRQVTSLIIERADGVIIERAATDFQVVNDFVLEQRDKAIEAAAAIEAKAEEAKKVKAEEAKKVKAEAVKKKAEAAKKKEAEQPKTDNT